MPNPSQTRTAHERLRWKPVRTRLPAWSTCIGGYRLAAKAGVNRARNAERIYQSHARWKYFSHPLHIAGTQPGCAARIHAARSEARRVARPRKGIVGCRWCIPALPVIPAGSHVWASRPSRRISREHAPRDRNNEGRTSKFSGFRPPSPAPRYRRSTRARGSASAGCRWSWR